MGDRWARHDWQCRVRRTLVGVLLLLVLVGACADRSMASSRGSPSASTTASPPASRVATPLVIAFLTSAGLMTMRADGSDLHLVSDRGGGQAGAPSWSPDGLQLAFPSGLSMANPTDNDIYLVDSDGSHVRNLSQDAQRNAAPRWSPTGQQIVYARSSRLVVADVSGTPPRLLLPEETTILPQLNPVWSPDGRQIAFDDAHTVYVVDADGANLHPLDHGHGDDAQPAWSPDGRQIAFTSIRDGQHWQIAMMQADGTGVRFVTSGAQGDDVSPVWSPDGRQIAFLRRSEVDQHIYVVATTGNTPPRPLTTDTARDGSVAWSPDGWQIAFLSVQAPASECGGAWKIRVMNVDGTNLQTLADGACNSGPAWRPSP